MPIPEIAKVTIFEDVFGDSTILKKEPLRLLCATQASRMAFNEAFVYQDSAYMGFIRYDLGYRKTFSIYRDRIANEKIFHFLRDISPDAIFCLAFYREIWFVKEKDIYALSWDKQDNGLPIISCVHARRFLERNDVSKYFLFLGIGSGTIGNSKKEILQDLKDLKYPSR